MSQSGDDEIESRYVEGSGFVKEDKSGVAHEEWSEATELVEQNIHRLKSEMSVGEERDIGNGAYVKKKENNEVVLRVKRSKLQQFVENAGDRLRQIGNVFS